MSVFYHIKSISEVHKMFNVGKPLHPLITVFTEWPESNISFEDIRLSSDLYLISMKGNSGSIGYGRNSYDYNEGALTFIAPNQVVSFDEYDQEDTLQSGWTIMFHPDLIRKSEFAKSIVNYSFFNYDINESLHISEKEQAILQEIVHKIAREIHQNIDKFSQELININIETLLKYCERYYERQFFTRTNINKDYVTKFDEYLNSYFSSVLLADNGLPTIEDCGKALNMSGSYLSDLLKIETGKSTKEHIYYHMIEKAKDFLIKTESPVNEIAYQLGYEYPQHFSKLFKAKTGKTPTEFRNSI